MSGSEPQPLTIPPEAPAMLLPGVVLFPHALLPLHIFEPQYRMMLAECLGGGRMFCIANAEPPRISSAENVGFAAGLGLIRACVANADGTSRLVLQGVARVRLLEFAMNHPFPLAQIAPVKTSGADLDTCITLAAEILKLCGHMPQQSPEAQSVHERLVEIDSPEILGDVVSHTFIKDAARRQQLLEEENLPQRLRLLLRHLQQEAQA